VRVNFLLTCNELSHADVDSELDRLVAGCGLEVLSRTTANSSFRGFDYIAVAQLAAPALSALVALLSCLAKRKPSGYVKLESPGMQLEIRANLTQIELAELVRELDNHLQLQYQNFSSTDCHVSL